MADKRIQIKDKSGNKLYPAIDLSLSNNLGTLPNEKIASVNVSKLTGTLPISKGGTGATTSSGARTNLGVYSKAEVDTAINNVTLKVLEVSIDANVSQLQNSVNDWNSIYYTGDHKAVVLDFIKAQKGIIKLTVNTPVGSLCMTLRPSLWKDDTAHSYNFEGSLLIESDLTSIGGTYYNQIVVRAIVWDDNTNVCFRTTILPIIDYYTKTEVDDNFYNKTEVDNLITGIDQFKYFVVTQLPTASASTMFIIYLIAESGVESGSYVEYLTIDKGSSANPRYVWEKIGTTSADLAEYSKNTHKHTFTGSQGNLSVSGTYSKTTGVTIGTGTGTANYTPAGSVTTTRATDVAVNTTTVNSITGVGTLPTLTTSTTSTTGDIPVLTDVSASHTLTVNHSDPTFSTSDVYSITGVGSLPTMTYDATAKGGQAYIKSLTKGSYTPAGTISASFAGTEVSKNVSITPKGSVNLGSNTTADGGVKYVEGISSTKASGTTQYIHPTTTTVVTGVTSNGTATAVTGVAADGTVAAVTGVAANGTASAITGTTKTTKYVTAAFTGNEVSGTVDLTAKGSIKLTNGTAPSLSISNATGTGYYQYVQGISSTGASGTSTGGFVTAINAGSGSLTSDDSSSGGILYAYGINSKGASVTASTSESAVTGINGGSGSLTADTNSTNGIKYIESIDDSDLYVVVTVSDKVTLSGSVTNKVLTIAAATDTDYLTTANLAGKPKVTTKYLHHTHDPASSSGSATFLKSVTVGGGTATLSTHYLHHSHSGASVKTTASAITAVSGGTTTPTLSYMKFNAGTTPKSGASFTGSSATGTVKLTPTGSVTLTSSTATSTGAITYLEGFTTTTTDVLTGVKATGTKTVLTGVKASGTATVLTGVKASGTTAAVTGLTTTTTSTTGDVAYISAVSGGTTTATTKYFHPSFTGAASTGNLTFTPAGSVTGTFNGTATTALVTGGTTSYMHFGQGSLPTRSGVIKAYTGVATAGSASLSGGVTANKTVGYLRFSQGSLPTKGSNVTVATGIKTQPTFNSTFSGTGTQLTASVTNTATTITSTGKFTPSGTIGTAE